MCIRDRLVILASIKLPLSWQEQPAELSKIHRQGWRFQIYGTPTKRTLLRKRLLAANPFLWLAARSWFKPVGVWLAVLFVGIWWVVVAVVFRFHWAGEFFCLTTGFILNCLLKLWIAVE